ncbi:MAG: TIGR00282 family metallophosphoesterase [Phycisphaerae bacterium]
MLLNIFCIGDIVGQPGRAFLANALPVLVKSHNIDFVIANAENSAGGSGLTPQIFQKLLHYGVDVVTLGDHCYKRYEIMQTLETTDRLTRPANLPPMASGKPFTVVKSRSGVAVGVATLLGRLYMKPMDCPFRVADQIVTEIRKQTPVVVIEMHAEATSEKVALGWYLDGRVSVVFGTHTHVPTADARILPNGAAYITDVGMTGPYESVLGRSKEKVIRSLITGMPNIYNIAEKDVRVAGILTTVDSNTGKAVKIEQLIVDEPTIEHLRAELKLQQVHVPKTNVEND